MCALQHRGVYRLNERDQVRPESPGPDELQARADSHPSQPTHLVSSTLNFATFTLHSAAKLYGRGCAVISLSFIGPRDREAGGYCDTRFMVLSTAAIHSL